jgi:hypothetical protein
MSVSGTDWVREQRDAIRMQGIDWVARQRLAMHLRYRPVVEPLPPMTSSNPPWPLPPSPESFLKRR